MTPTSTTGILRALSVALVLALAPVHAAAQEPDTDGVGRVHVGPLALNPRIGWQTGYEDNVFRTTEGQLSDIVSTLSAGTDIRGRLRRLGLFTTGTADWVHFDKLASERGANVDGTLRLDLLFNRVTPYMSSSYRNSRQRSNFEVDTRPRIEQSTIAVGTIFRLGGKTSVDISARHLKEVYDRNAAFDGVNLGSALNRGSDSVALSLLQQVTPLTSFDVRGEVFRDRYDASQRSADNVRLTTGFQSDGRINGSARVGVRILKPHDLTLPESRGVFVALSTSAALRDRLQVGLDAQRDLIPSYRGTVAYYASYSYGGSLTYAIRRSLRLSAQVSRRLADYRARGGAADQEGVDRETRYGSGISYLLGESMRFDFTGTYTKRASPLVLRRFDGLSARAGVSYGF